MFDDVISGNLSRFPFRGRYLVAELAYLVNNNNGI